MMQTSITTRFGASEGASDFRLMYVAEDNVLPSKVEGALENLAAQLKLEGEAVIRTHPTLWGIHASTQIANAVREASRDPKVRAGEQLFAQDERAWPIRKLRLYPPGPALIRCSTGSVVTQHVEMATLSEQLVFTGSDRAASEYAGFGAAISATGRVYDTQGNLLDSVHLEYVEGNVRAPGNIYGIVQVDYTATYQVIQLTVTPTGGAFDVLVSAFRDGRHTSATVAFEPVEFDPAEETLVSGGGMSFGTEWPPVQEAVEEVENSVWTESRRKMSSIDVGGVTVQRIEEVTFNRATGSFPITLKFNNSGVD